MTFTQKMRMVFSNIWTFIGPAVLIFLTAAGQVLAQSAMDAVMQIEKDPSLLGDAERRNAAFDLILNDLKRRGIQVAAREINRAIEIAVEKIQAKQ